MRPPHGQEATIGQDIIALYDEYTHAPLPRRVFMRRLTAMTGSAVSAAALLPLLQNNYAQAAVIPPDAANIIIQTVGYPGEAGTISGHLVQPKSGSRFPAVLVIHENRGLNPHIEDIARRLASAGFLALAPDYLTPQGGTPNDEDKARDMIARLEETTVNSISLASLKYLKTHPAGTGKVGCVGFCWGGGAVNRLAVLAPDLDAAVSFYGMQPPAADVARIRAPLLLHYAGLDERINAGIPAYETALRAARKMHEIFIYAGVNHAFNNDTNIARYNAEAANLAWQRTLEFLQRYLG